VYKRVLFAHLCTPPNSNESSTRNTDQNHSSELSVSQGSASDLATTGADAIDRDADWSPEHIVKILKQSGGFSISVVADLKEVRDAPDSSALAKRSLPLGSILKQNQMLPEAQKYQNAKLIMGAAMEDEELVAQALEDGAEINTVSNDGHTALQISLAMSPRSDIAALLLLYKETKRHFRDVAATQSFYRL
jgi:hypothetical protein